ncbi:histidine kinase [Lysinibacillus sp. VIII_CA]|uniref:histidine kinase n=2 Tax=Bacillaceae TaxID=186817 RepID=UPI0019D53380|nr:histidine kinase [Lysinibacillus sphaericus]MBG9694390.1 histidine kinase [Lysinibacillus sphaericus]MBG9756806.1 histidine kinase [Lysinibacillus sphaericus]
MKKKIIIFNLLFCIVVIFVSYNYFNSKSRNAIVYSYVENYMETNYGIGREDLKSEENNYRRGMALFEIEVKDVVTKDYYFFEVKIRDDYSLISIKDLSELNRKNHHKNQDD